MTKRHVTLMAAVVLAAVCVKTPLSARSDTYPRQPGIKVTNYTFDYTLSDQNNELGRHEWIDLCL